jgi:hypothetical protein
MLFIIFSLFSLFLCNIYIYIYIYAFRLFCLVKFILSTCCWCLLGRRSLNLESIPLDPELERNLGRKRRAPIGREFVEMGDNLNMDQPRGENGQPRAENVDYTRSLRDLFAPLRRTLLRV